MKCLISDEEMSNAERDRVRARAALAFLSLLKRIKYEEERKVEATKVGKGRYAAFFCGLRERPHRESSRDGETPPGRRPPRAGGGVSPPATAVHKNAIEHITKQIDFTEHIYTDQFTYEQAGRSAAAHSEVRTAHTIAHAACPGCGPMHIRLLFRRNFETGEVISLS